MKAWIRVWIFFIRKVWDCMKAVPDYSFLYFCLGWMFRQSSGTTAMCLSPIKWASGSDHAVLYLQILYLFIGPAAFLLVSGSAEHQFPPLKIKCLFGLVELWPADSDWDKIWNFPSPSTKNPNIFDIARGLFKDPALGLELLSAVESDRCVDESLINSILVHRNVISASLWCLLLTTSWTCSYFENFLL